MNNQLTIIIPVYNGEEILFKQIEKIQSSNIGINLMIVDDCSSNDSYKKLLLNQNITLIKTKKNSGSAGIPRMMGLSYVQTPYVYFLDADDILNVEILLWGLEKMINEKLDLIKFNVVIDDGIREKQVLNLASYYFNNSAEVFESCSFLGAHIYKMDIIINNNLKINQGIAEDLNFNYKYLEYIEKGYFLNKNIITYNKNITGTANNLNEKNKENLLTNLKEVFKIFENRNYNDLWIEKMKTILIERNLLFNNYQNFSPLERQNIIKEFNINNDIHQIVKSRSKVIKMKNEIKLNVDQSILNDYIIQYKDGQRIVDNENLKNANGIMFEDGTKIKSINDNKKKMRTKLGYIKRSIKKRMR